MSIPAQVRENASETIRVRPTEYNGRDLLDVRVWYKSPTGEMKPTKKGLTLRPETAAKRSRPVDPDGFVTETERLAAELRRD